MSGKKEHREDASKELITCEDCKYFEECFTGKRKKCVYRQ